MRTQNQSDVFAEALARVKRRELESELAEPPSYRHQSIGAIVKLAVAAAGAALIALVCVVVLRASLGSFEDSTWSPALPSWQGLKSSLLPTPPRKPAPTLIVRDNSGLINEPLELGISVDAPAPGTTVVINRLPAGARLTAGARVSANQWRVPAQEISNAAIIPPTNFVGEMNLSVELHGADGGTLVAAFDRLSWTSPQPASTVAASASATPTVPPGPPAVLAPQQPQAMASPPPTAARVELARELSPNEIASFVRRAQELLASGDLQGARALLLHAAAAHDARAALFLARTFDPMVSRQSGAADPVQDLAQARSWYQIARDWGSPEAQRQLDALASYPRR
jgi:hypothetical protein